MTEAGFRRLALKMPEAMEGSHMGHADFRAAGKIFATCGFRKGFGVLMLTPEQQSGMVGDAPEIFLPVPGAWGKKGCTMVALAKITPDVLEPALRLAWRNKVQKKTGNPKKSARARR